MNNILETRNEVLRDSASLIQSHRPVKWGGWPTARKSTDPWLLMYGTALTVITGSLAIAALSSAPAPMVIGAGMIGGVASGISAFVARTGLTLATKAFDLIPNKQERLVSTINRIQLAGVSLAANIGLNDNAKAIIEEGKSIEQYFLKNHDQIFSSTPGDNQASQQTMARIISDIVNDKLLRHENTPISLKDIESVIDAHEIKPVNNTLKRAIEFSNEGKTSLGFDSSLLKVLDKPQQKAPADPAPSR